MPLNDRSGLYKGVQTAKGDRLVDVLEIWGYRVQKDLDRGDYGAILEYSINLLPEIAAIIKREQTDVELRATAAETLVAFVLALDEITGAKGFQTARIEAVRNEAVTGLTSCFSLPVSIRAKSSIARAARRFRQTGEVASLRAAILHDPACGSDSLDARR